MRDDGAELHARRQLLHAADVIVVIVRDDEVVERPDARSLDGRGNALRISASCSRPAGVDQHRLPGRG